MRFEIEVAGGVVETHGVKVGPEGAFALRHLPTGTGLLRVEAESSSGEDIDFDPFELTLVENEERYQEIVPDE